MSNSEGILGVNKAVVFPLCPTKILIGTRRREFTWRLTADTNMYEQLKKLIIDNAFLFIYAAEEDPEISHYRKRIENKELYDKIQKDFETWYDDYRDTEGPLLTKNPTIKSKQI